MTDWLLIGTGPRKLEEWDLLADELAGWNAGWADLDGFHLEPIPPVPPLATHLWAWTLDGWLRVRLEGDGWTASALLRRPPLGLLPAESSLWSSNRESVADVSRTKILSWSKNDDRVKQLTLVGGAQIPPEMWQLTPVRASTAVFVGTTATLAES